MSFWLGGLAKLYLQSARLKNYLYDSGLLATNKVKPRVISVGNLTVGGTGKTPFVDFLVKLLFAQGYKVAVISKSYRAQADRPTKVDRLRDNAAAFYGDEAFLLAQKNKQVDFYVGPSKLEVAQYATQEGNYDFLIVDDGFQHRRLHRDLDILILDATESIDNYQVLPLGRGREPLSGIERAQVILITKVNLVSPQHLESLLSLVPQSKTLLFADYNITRLHDLSGAVEVHLGEGVFADKCWLVSGIARPFLFEKMVAEHLQVEGHTQYRDHHPYSAKDIEQVLTAVHRAGAQAVTTEKDAVKLKDLWPLHEKLWVAPLEMKIHTGVTELNEILRQIASR